MDHDPLCPAAVMGHWPACAYCDLIARVRADERRLARGRVLAVARSPLCDDEDCQGCVTLRDAADAADDGAISRQQRHMPGCGCTPCRVEWPGAALRAAP